MIISQSGTTYEQVLEALLKAAQSAYGTAINTEEDTLAFQAKIYPICKVIADAYQTVYNFENAFDVEKTVFLDLLENQFRLTPSQNDTEEQRREAIRLKLFQASHIPNKSTVKDYLKLILSNLYLETLEYENLSEGNGFSTDPENWHSKLSSLPVRVQRPASMPYVEFLTRVNRFKGFLGDFLPAYMTFHWGAFTKNNGTVSAAANSVTITGTGTLFINAQTGALKVGETVEVIDILGDIVSLKIASVNSNTSFTVVNAHTQAISGSEFRLKGFILSSNPAIRNLGYAFFTNRSVVPFSAPTIVYINPSTGSMAGGTVFNIVGTQFQTGVSVTFNGVPASSIVYSSPTYISGVTPASGVSGTISVVLTNPDSGTASTTFSYLSTAPSITGTTLVHTDGGLLTVSGTNFASGAVIKTEGVNRSTSFINSTTLRCSAPGHAAGSVSVVVTNPDTQTASSTMTYYNVAGQNLTSYFKVENWNPADNSWTSTASAGTSGARAAMSSGTPHTSTRTINGYTLPRVDSPTGGYWNRLQSASAVGFTNALTEYLFTTVVYIDQEETNVLPGGSSGSFGEGTATVGNYRSLLLETSANFYALFGRNGSGQHSVCVGGLLNDHALPGAAYSAPTLCPIGQAVVVQFGIRSIASQKYFSIRSSADAAWKDTSLGAASLYYYNPANHHIGYNGAVAARQLGGAIGDFYQTIGATASNNTVSDGLFAAMKSKFNIA